MIDELAARRARRAAERAQVDVAATIRFCPCGSAWFTTPAMSLTVEGTCNGYALPLTCIECGEEVTP